MDDRIVRFIADLRAAGVRISMAESQDAARGLTHLDSLDRETFRAALQTTLVKDHADDPIFDKLFPLHFCDAPKFLSPERALSPDQQKILKEALQVMPVDSSRLLQQLASGRSPMRGELRDYAQQVKETPLKLLLGSPRIPRGLRRQLSRAIQLDPQIAQLSKLLAARGMNAAGVRKVQHMIGANQESMASMAGQFMDEADAPPLEALLKKEPSLIDLDQLAFNLLSVAEAHVLRQEVRRLGRKLRTRAALRQKKGAGKKLDAKTTLRASLRTGGIPFRLHFRKKHLKPKFVLFCDVSGSMGPAAEFMLRLMYLDFGQRVAPKRRSLGWT
jgi:uncharacterized protein with von Willebrand factor type A (vWA) domain